MRRLALMLLLSLAASAPARAQAPPDAAAIRTVISGQIEALRRDDAAGAFSRASPGIQAMFGTPEHFLAMVRKGYAPVYRPSSVRFGALSEEDGTPVQRVELVGADGDPATALYSMEHEADGSWRIAGCTLLHPQRLET